MVYLGQQWWRGEINTNGMNMAQIGDHIYKKNMKGIYFNDKTAMVLRTDLELYPTYSSV